MAPRSWTFTIPVPDHLPTANDRLSWQVKARLNASIRTNAQVVARSERIRFAVTPNVDKRRNVMLALVRGKVRKVRHNAEGSTASVTLQRLLDVDNLYAALKPVADALTLAQWIVSDNSRWIEYSVKQWQDRNEDPHVIVTISEMKKEGAPASSTPGGNP